MVNKRKDYESFKIGQIEVIRDGKVVSIRNTGNEEEIKQHIKTLAQNYEKNVNDINCLVSEIKELISECNPLELLKYGYNNFFISQLGVLSEIQSSDEQVYMAREIEYIQSVLVSNKNSWCDSKKNVCNDDNFRIISMKIRSLYKLTLKHLLYHTAYLKEKYNEEFDYDKEEFLFEAQMSMFIRGDRYSVYEIPHIRELLEPHNDEFLKLYNISVDEIINGLENIKVSLSRGIGNIFSELKNIMNVFEVFSENEVDDQEKYEDSEDLMKKFHEYISRDSDLSKIREDICSGLAGYGLFDLNRITNWTEEFMNDLSFEINENDKFYNNDKYSGWPLIELPVSERPFIKVDNKFYCFDYYNLFDNFYRVIQKTLKRRDSSYSQEWAKRQMDVTEHMVANLFKKILPGCKVYTSNYYPKNKSLKQCAENDIMVIYDDNLIIAEVKAGSYTYRSPILDVESHIKSLKTLVEVADGQAERTLNYLKSNETVKLYDNNKMEKFSITLSDFNEVTLMCITLDNFNEFASKIEKMNFLSLNKKTIAISIDDFRVYSDYFDSPLIFLHYLKQRKLATQNKSLYLNDELDHLGMYIEHNMYVNTFKDDELCRIQMHGYRQLIDEYFNSLGNEFLEVKKPIQVMPDELKKIIDFIDKSQLKGRDKLASFLLNFSSDTRINLIEMIKKVLIRQKEIGRMLALNLFGETPVCIFCHQKGVSNMTLESTRDYTLATMLEVKECERLELNLMYNEQDDIEDIRFKFYSLKDINDESRAELIELGHKYAKSRVQSYKNQEKIKKIGRNDPCPCGSGKKYKKCHGS